MVCPACQHPAEEKTASCSKCGFTLPGLDRLLGIPPVLKYPLTDMRRVFSAADVRRIERQVLRLEHRFPGVRGAVVTAVTHSQISLGLYTFWLFNRGGLTSAVERGSHNRLILLVIDTQAHKASCMIGYGLEPFFSPAAQQACLQVMMAELARDKYGPAVLKFFQQLDSELEKAVQSLPRTFGLNENEYTGLRDLTKAQVEPAAKTY
jgi:uncharacterized membrane protein YgcG